MTERELAWLVVHGVIVLVGLERAKDGTRMATHVEGPDFDRRLAFSPAIVVMAESTAT
jgi:hypothetical protein